MFKIVRTSEWLEFLRSARFQADKSKSLKGRWFTFRTRWFVCSQESDISKTHLTKDLQLFCSTVELSGLDLGSDSFNFISAFQNVWDIIFHLFTQLNNRPFLSRQSVSFWCPGHQIPFATTQRLKGFSCLWCLYSGLCEKLRREGVFAGMLYLPRYGCPWGKHQSWGTPLITPHILLKDDSWPVCRCSCAG